MGRQTNLVTGETFAPIYRKMTLENNDDKSYTLQTRETGILIFAKKPIVQVLSSIMNLDLEDEIYSIDLNTFKVENNLESIEHVSTSNQGVVRAYLDEVTGQEYIQLSLLTVGVAELTIIAVNTSNERVSYSYIVNVEQDLDGDGISNKDEILAGTNPHMIETNIVPVLYLLL